MGLIESSVVNEGKEDLKRLAVESFQIFFIHTGLINNPAQGKTRGSAAPYVKSFPIIENSY